MSFEMFPVKHVFFLEISIRSRSDCGITENGILQYRGKHSVSKFGHECLHWAEFDEIFLDIFNETKNELNENFCRNPTLNVTGPWCFVRNDETIEMESCDVCQSLSKSIDCSIESSTNFSF